MVWGEQIGQLPCLLLQCLMIAIAEEIMARGLRRSRREALTLSAWQEFEGARDDEECGGLWERMM